jgi:branched-chain amino acid transport system permease protein
MLVVGGLTSLAGAVIGSMLLSLVAELLRRAEGGVHIGSVHIPGRPGLSELGLALIMILILVLRPRGITGGRELGLPRARTK